MDELFNMPAEKKISETENYKIFSKEIDYLISFFDCYSELIFSNGKLQSFITDKEFYLFDTTLIDCSAQTLKSIKLCCSIGSFSDANALIRKLRDDLIQYIYIANIVNLRKPFKEYEPNMAIHFNSKLTDDELAVAAWFANDVNGLPKRIKRKLEFKNYMNVLKQNEKIQHLLSNYQLQEYWGTLRSKLNDYVHNNGKRYSSHNFVSAKNKYCATHLKNVAYRAAYISSFFLILLLMIDSSLISSTDYMDHLECNIEPPEGSQYFIANFVQDFINKKVSKLHPEMKQYLKDNNIYGMQIE